MPWNWLKSGARDRKSEQGRDSSLWRLLRIIAEEPGVHAFIARATRDQDVVTAARTLAQPLLRGEDVPEQCRTLCRSLGVSEGLLRSRLWAMASLFPGPPVLLAPHRILGLMPGAGPKLVQGAFRKLCLTWHPDLNPGDPEAARRFLQIKAAYDMLAGAGESYGQAAGSGACAWDDFAYGRPRRTRTRMRLLMPLILVVGVLVLAVAVTDLESPRVRSAILSSVAAVGFGPVINASVCSGSVLKLEQSCLLLSTGRTVSTPGGEANHPHR